MRNIIKITILTALCTTVVSCNLDRFPSTTLSKENAKEVAEYKMIREGVYSAFTKLYTGEFLYHPDYQSDLFTELSTSGNRGGDFARWNLKITDSDIERVWNMHYAAITNANMFIGGVDNVIEKADNEEDKAALSVMKGEMYLLRAMSFRQLALHFCKDYEPETAASEFGVPIVETFDLNHKPHRGTLADTYARITKDIEEAERLITTPGASNAKYLTADCVTAFKAQVYLDMHRYDEASQAAKSLYSKYDLAQSAADIESMWRQDLSSETIFQFAIGKTEIDTEDPDMRFVDYHGGQLSGGVWNCAAGYVPEKWVCDLFTAEDWRTGTVIGTESVIQMKGGNNADLTVLRKYIGNESLRTDENTLRFVTMPKVFRIAEMYLIDAEAQYMDGGTGIEPLNALRKARGLAEIIASDDNMFTEIQNERVREMIAEGGRLADLKRWKQGFQRDVQDSPDILVASSATATMAKEAGDFMFVWPIPNSEVSVNPNLTDEQNEGWN